MCSSIQSCGPLGARLALLLIAFGDCISRCDGRRLRLVAYVLALPIVRNVAAPAALNVRIQTE